MSILIKGRAVVLVMTNGTVMNRPASHAIIHDPRGELLPRNHVFIGPYRLGRDAVDLDGDGRAYFGPKYEASSASVDVPAGPWKSVGQASGIVYERDRGKYANERRYRHAFKRPVDIDRCGSMLRMRLPPNAVVNWRGFVSP